VTGSVSGTDPLGLKNIRDLEVGASAYFGASFFNGSTIDGLEAPTGMVQSLLKGGGGLECPNNQCARVGTDNRLQYFAATTSGTGAYYNYRGPGSMFYSVQAAGAAAASATAQGQNDKHEYWSNIYQDDNGLYSYSALQQGPLCQVGQNCHWSPDYNDHPGTLVGGAHNHPANFGSEEFSQRPSMYQGRQISGDIDVYLSFTPQLYGFLLTRSNPTRILMFDPNAFQTWFASGVSNPICVLVGVSHGVPPACH